MVVEYKRAEEIMQSHGVIDVNYNGMPVWIEAIKGDMAEITFIGLDRSLNIEVNELNEAGPIHSI